MSEEQFRALELWILAAGAKAAQVWPVYDSTQSYFLRRDEAKRLLVAESPPNGGRHD